MISLRTPLMAIALTLVLGACKKVDTTLDAPPLAGFRTYDVIPIAVKQLPGGAGFVLPCKRAITDAHADYAQFLSNTGDPTVRIDYATLPRTIENISFAAEDVVITDILPWGDGTYILAGFGRQTELEDRLHLLIHHVDASGNTIEPPIRRFIITGSVLARNDDLNELYRTTALVQRTANGDLVVAIRYEDDNHAGIRVLRISLSSGNEALTKDFPLASTADHLHALFMRANDEVLMFSDTTGNGSATHLLVTSLTFGASTVTSGTSGIITMDNAEPYDIFEADGMVKVVGRSSTADVLTPFSSMFAHAADAGNAAHALTIGGANSAACYAAMSSGGGSLCAFNVFDQPVVAPETERNDRFSDLRLAIVSNGGAMSNERTILTAEGARAMGCFQVNGKTVVIGALHPFLNADYLHAFLLQVGE